MAGRLPALACVGPLVADALESAGRVTQGASLRFEIARESGAELPELWLAAARSGFRAALAAQAAEATRTFVAASGGRAGAWDAVAEAAGDAAAELAALEAALAASPGPERAVRALRLGRALALAGRAEVALRVLPEEGWVRGLALARQGRRAEAERWLRREVARRPRALLLADLAGITAAEDALTLAHRARALDPDDAEVAALALATVGRRDPAHRQFAAHALWSLARAPATPGRGRPLAEAGYRAVWGRDRAEGAGR